MLALFQEQQPVRHWHNSRRHNRLYGRASTRSSDEISLQSCGRKRVRRGAPFFSLMPEIATANLNPVIGSGTPGFVSRWQGVSDSFTYTLGNSNIFEDKYGKIGIGTTAPASLLTVQGMVETTLGGYKFPDGTLQTTAGISFVTHDTSLAGLGTQASPLWDCARWSADCPSCQ